MSRRNVLLGSLLAALVVAGSGAAALLLRQSTGPFPTEREIARTGFAAWPADTPEEAREECADAADWRKDPQQVAKRFASEVMGYPAPTVDSDFEARDENVYRTLINSDGVKGVFLGSVLTIDRFGECWYVTDGEGREGGWGIDISTLDAGRKLVVPVSCCGTVVEVGWGPWTEKLESKERSVEMVVDIPDEAMGHPGHYIVTHFDKAGVSEVVGVRTLPPLPDGEGAEELEPLDVGRRPDDPKLCRMAWARKGHPERIIRELRSWPFESGLGLTDAGYSRFDTYSKKRSGSDFEWRVRSDEADLRFAFSRAADRCWIIRSIEPRGSRIIERVSAGPYSFTFDLDPGRATKVIVYYGVGGEAQPVSIDSRKLLGDPFSVSRSPDFPPRNEGLPAYALVITYRKGNMHSAEYRLFDMQGRD